MNKWLKRLLIALGCLVGLVLALEAAMRFRQYKRYGTTVASYYEFAQDPETGLRIPKPGHTVGPISVNSLGFRGPEIETPKPEGRVRIAFVGASTTFCAEASSFETTWPYLVVEGLRAAAPDVDFDFVNCGSGGFRAEHSFRSLKARVMPLEPDVVVFYGATNDLTVASQKRATADGLWKKEENDSPAAGRFSMTIYLIEKNIRHLLRTREGARELLRCDPRELSPVFKEDLTKLVRYARENDQVVALVTFSTRIRHDQTPEEQDAAADPARFFMPFLDARGLLAGYDEFNRVIREVATREGTILIEGEDRIPGDAEHFKDTVHFSDPGLRIQADRVLEGLLAAPAFQALLDERRGR